MEQIINQGQPVSQTPKSNYRLVFLVVILITLTGLLGYQLGKTRTETPIVTPPIITQAPKAQPTISETADWKTYKNEVITFKHPLAWEEKPIQPRGSGFTQEFKDPEGKISFSFMTQGNYSQLTGKPYTTLDEFIGMPYKVKPVIIDGQEGRQPNPRAGSENVFSVYFFSKDLKNIYNLNLQVGDTALNTPEVEVQKGQTIFNQILSTFKFLP